MRAYDELVFSYDITCRDNLRKLRGVSVIRQFCQLNSPCTTVVGKLRCSLVYDCTNPLTFPRRADCEHFEMSAPEFATADELRADLDNYEQMWSMYDEFNSGLSDLSKEDWISFRWVSVFYQTFIVYL